METRFTRRNWLLAAGSAALSPRVAAAADAEKKGAARSLQGAFMILSTPYTSSKAVDYDDLAGRGRFFGSLRECKVSSGRKMRASNQNSARMSECAAWM